MGTLFGNDNMTCFESERRTIKSKHKTIKSSEEKAMEQAVKAGFPNCRGAYPDCPKNPTIEKEKCRTCPVPEEIMDNELL